MQIESTFTVEDRTKLISVGINLENLQNTMNELKDAYKEDGKALETRVRALENFRYWILGMGVVGGAVVHLILDRFRP